MYFKELLNVENGREAVIVAVGTRRRAAVIDEENDRRVNLKEVQDALNKMKTGKAQRLDGCHVKCMMKGGRVTVEWLARMFSVCFREGAVPLEWKSTCMVPLYIRER